MARFVVKGTRFDPLQGFTFVVVDGQPVAGSASAGHCRISNYTNHLVGIPLDAAFAHREWTPALR